MKCNYCKVEMEKRHATDERAYAYKQSGLQGLFLSGIDVYRCPKCEGESPVIPKVAQLYTCVADGIIRQPRLLNGDEIRFLRKHAALPAQKFARLLGISAEHLSRVENGHTRSFGKNTDRLIRAVTLTAKKGEDARRMLLSLADDLDKAGHKPPKRSSRIIDLSYALKVKEGWQRFKHTG